MVDKYGKLPRSDPRSVIEERPELTGWSGLICFTCKHPIVLLRPNSASAGRCPDHPDGLRVIHDLAKPCKDCIEMSDLVYSEWRLEEEEKMKITAPQKAHSELDTLLNLETYCRSLIFAQDYKPGDDLGQQALALAHLGIRSALLELDKIRVTPEKVKNE